jgi:hypothetical protein
MSFSKKINPFFKLMMFGQVVVGIIWSLLRLPFFQKFDLIASMFGQLLKWIDLYIMYLTLTLTFILLLMKKA